MTTYQFDAIFTDKGWVAPGFLTCDTRGKVVSVGTKASAADVTKVDGYFLPGFTNGHSHAFQFAMVGLAERLASDAKDDDFWTWREIMYKLALAVDPDDVFAIARYLYTLMLENGTTAVAEFQYLHHDQNGKPYARLGEMSEQLLAAAKEAGIHLTLVPIYYKNGDFDEASRPTQRRFISQDREQFLRLLAELKSSMAKNYPGMILGSGVHSLRAASQDDVRFLLDPKSHSGPLHIHVAEQMQEVRQCEKVWGKRPVTWLLDNVALSVRHNLVHATHMTVDEIQNLARTQATVVVCPSTEGNLGDGFFKMADYRAHNGSWAIGTDSHVGLNFFEELRWLDYGQRLLAQKRNVLCRKNGEKSGELAFGEAWRGGRRALGLEDTAWSVAEACDGVLLDKDHHALCGKPLDQSLSCAVYGGDSRLVKAVMREGQWVIKEGRHPKHAAHREAFVKTLKKLF